MNSPRPVAISCRITVAGSHFKYSEKKKNTCVPDPGPDWIRI